MKNVLALCTIPFTTFSIFLCRSFSSRSIIALSAFRTFSLLVRTLLAGLSFFSLRFQRLIRRAIISYFPATSVSPYVTWLTVSSGFFISSSRFMQIPPGYHERSLLPSLPFLPSLSTFRLAPYLRVCFFCYNSSLLLILLLRPTLPTPSRTCTKLPVAPTSLCSRCSSLSFSFALSYSPFYSACVCLCPTHEELSSSH